MLEWLGTVLTSATVSGLVIALFKDFLTERLRAAIKTEYDLKLESHKAQLQAANQKELEVLKSQLKAQADVEVEQLRAQLQIQASQQNLTFSRLHERRVQAISVLYQRLIPLRDAVANYISLIQPAGASDVVNLKLVDDAYILFKAAIEEHSLFLPRQIADAVDLLDRTCIQVTNQFTIVVKADKNQPNTTVWMQLAQDFQTGADQAIIRLREDMRVALGDAPEVREG